jgi:hypothetical protein
MPQARLNVFQRLVRQWDSLHPYNAGQVLRIAGPAPINQLNNAWAETVTELGLGKVRFQGRDYFYEELNGEMGANLPRMIPAGVSLEAFISDELNKPFGRHDIFPFRPFIHQTDDSYYLGVIYQHWVADSVSIRVLLREWFLRIHDPKSARREALPHPEGGYWRLFGPAKARWSVPEGLLSSVRWSSRFKRVRRLEDPAFNDYRVKFSLHRLPEGKISRLHAAAKARGMTLNDLFLAAIAVACDKYVPVIPTSKRQDLALGTIVDLRRYVNDDLSDQFGLFLGFTSVILRPHHLKDWNTILKVVATQGSLHKKTGVPQASSIRMLAGILAGKMLDPNAVANFYRKRVPLAGGISNVNLNNCWAREYHPSPLVEYIRVSPTGPMMPLVFTTTTLGDRFHFGLTRRASVVPDPAAGNIAATFVERLESVLG